VGIFGGSPQDQVDLDGLTDRVARLEAAVASLQAKLAALTGGTAAAEPPTGEWMAEVHALKASGNLIQAIKVYREHTGLGLRESKDAVEGL